MSSSEELEDEALARALGRFERQRGDEHARTPEWEAVAHGELSVEEASARRLAAGDTDVARAAEYFRPYAVDETAALVDALLEPPAAPEAKPDNVVPFLRPMSIEAPAPSPQTKPHDPGSSRFWWIPGGMLATAAAAIVMWWVWPPSDDVRSLDSEGGEVVAVNDTALPGYVLETDGGLEHLRGEEGETSPDDARHRYRRDSSFEWVLRPKADVEGEVAVRAFAFVDGGNAGLPLQLDALADVAPTGAIRIAGKIGELKLEPGRYTIALAVGRPEDLPTQAATVAAHDQQAQAEWSVRRVDVVIEE